MTSISNSKYKFMEKITLIVNEFSNENIGDNLFILITNSSRALLIRDIEQANIVTRSLNCDGILHSLYVLRNIDNKYTLTYINIDNDTRKMTDTHHFDTIRSSIEKFLNNVDSNQVEVKYFQKRGGPF